MTRPSYPDDTRIHHLCILSCNVCCLHRFIFQLNVAMSVYTIFLLMLATMLNNMQSNVYLCIAWATSVNSSAVLAYGYLLSDARWYIFRAEDACKQGCPPLPALRDRSFLSAEHQGPGPNGILNSSGQSADLRVWSLDLNATTGPAKSAHMIRYNAFYPKRK